MKYIEKVKIELATIFSQSGIAELEDNIFPNIGNATRVSYRKGDYKMSIILQSLEDESNGVKSIKESIWYYPANDTPKLLEYIHNTGYLYDYQDDIVSVVANSMMERIDYLYSNGITKIPHYKDVEDYLKQKAEIDKLGKSLNMSNTEHIELYGQLQAEYNKNKKLAKKLKRLDSKKSRKIWKVLLSYMKDERYTSDKLLIWSICNDLIMKFPELEGEEDLQKEFVELYNINSEK